MPCCFSNIAIFCPAVAALISHSPSLSFCSEAKCDKLGCEDLYSADNALCARPRFCYHIRLMPDRSNISRLDGTRMSGFLFIIPFLLCFFKKYHLGDIYGRFARNAICIVS